jgi:trans-2,3-dihydro-3-hydroxyanthranilate isomerase
MSCGAGVLPIVLTVDPDGRIGEVELTAGTPSAGPPLPSSTSSAVLAALSLDGSAAAPGRAMRVCSTGLAQAFLCVRESVLADVRVDVAALAAVASEGGWDTISVFSWDSAVAVAHARVFADGLGWGEDPATGSAGSAFGAWLVAEGLATTDGEFAYVIEQGVEMGRPSRISGTVVASGGQPLACRVAGRVASVASGLIEVPTAPPPHTDGRVSGTVVTRVTE